MRVVRRVLAFVFVGVVGQAFQPDSAALRRLFEEALSRRRAEHGEADGRTAQAARDLALFLQRTGDVAASQQAFREAIRLDEQAYGAKAAQTLEDVSLLASVSPAKEAEPLYRRVTESEDPALAGPAFSALASLRKSAGDKAGAAALLRQSILRAEAVEGKEGAIVALLLNQLALLVEAREALSALERAVQIDQLRFGDKAPETRAAAALLSKTLRGAGRVAEAVALERRFSVPAPR